MKDVILKEISKIIIPFIQIFGIYVIFHGHLSPGGGFAGGTIIGASLILYRLVYGGKQAKQKLAYKTLMNIICFSVFLYGILKGYSFITGGSHINLPQPPLGDPGYIFSGGFLLPLNILVGIIVAISMYFFYSLFDEGEI
ncbi:MnhB domain-containing protein [Clostridium brassicae]|uniref:MnhB domain-containing protein n=1 Tax=Clostridium brassicae TaxID=2999072 RepID=A0ABT4D7D7_9CLOT|nr:MnhB domain-containing protein [Clostridium brassicae]MCY6958073.1 MnhB domain-containing protein [Clostridium brassicae]